MTPREIDKYRSTPDSAASAVGCDFLAADGATLVETGGSQGGTADCVDCSAREFSRCCTRDFSNSSVVGAVPDARQSCEREVPCPQGVDNPGRNSSGAQREEPPYHCTKMPPAADLEHGDDLAHAFVRSDVAVGNPAFSKPHVKYSADDDFDRLILEQWQRHMREIGPEKARVRGWGGSYWQKWVEQVDIGEAAEASDGNKGDVAFIPLFDDRRPAERLSDECYELWKVQDAARKEAVKACLESREHRRGHAESAILGQKFFPPVLAETCGKTFEGFSCISGGSASATEAPSIDESTVEWPPGAEDGRPVEPAESAQHMQGGSTQSKLAPEFDSWDAFHQHQREAREKYRRQRDEDDAGSNGCC